MWWKWILQAAIALGLDKWAKKKAVEIVAKLKARAEKKAEAIEAAVKEKVDEVLATDGHGNKFVVKKEGDTVTVKRV